MSEFRYPNITGDTQQQLSQLKSYLYQLVEALNYSRFSGDASAQPSGVSQQKKEILEQDFVTLKSMIIKSADIVQAYTDKIDKVLSGKYVAQSEFGTYSHSVDQQILAEAGKLEQKFESLQTVVTQLQTTLLQTQGYIRTGILYYAGEAEPLPEGAPVYGMEVGQVAEDGSFQRFGRFTAYSLSFFDSTGVVFAAITEGKLQIRGVQIGGSLTLGGFRDEVQSDGALVTRWIGVG